MRLIQLHWAAPLLWLLVGGDAVADRIVQGTVFADLDGTGSFTAADEPLAGVGVFWESSHLTQTDAAGAFSLLVPDGEGILWARTPDGFGPGRAWVAVPATGDRTADLGLAPLELVPGAPLDFAVASDTHMGLEGLTDADLRAALDQAIDLDPPPAFLAITGDLTQGNQPEHFAALAAGMLDFPIPFVPIPGNHDWYDGGATYRSVYGPPTYSFELGGAHFLVLNDSASLQERLDFLALDLGASSPDAQIIAFMHAPPDVELTEALASHGVDYLFTGHIHSNRVLRHATMVEYNTQPLLMGGLDQAPAGYRLVSLGGDGTLAVEHRTYVATPVTRQVHPMAGDCRSSATSAIAAAEVGATRPVVDSSFTYVGGWAYTGPPPATLDSLTECVDDHLELREWTQLQGSPRHQGATDRLIAPPLRTRWAVALGDHITGPPVSAGGRVFVGLADFGDGSRGGVVALDARTGAEAWRATVDAGVRNSPAIVDGIVVAGGLDGRIHAFAAATGEELWQYQLAADFEPLLRSFYAAPTIVDGAVHVGVQRELTSLALADGALNWPAVPGTTGGWFGSASSSAVDEGVVVTSFSRGGFGLLAWDAGTGASLWQTAPGFSRGAHVSALIHEGVVYFGNELTRVRALDLQDGQEIWNHQVDETGFDWGNGLPAPFALGGTTLLVPAQNGVLYALDSNSGAERWRVATEAGPLSPMHYRPNVAYASAPVITDDVVWFGGADGRLRAVALDDGQELWSTDLGAPILAGPVPAGSYLFVATYDGVLRALVPVSESGPLPPPPEGCGCSSRSTPAPTFIVALAFFLAIRTRAATRRARAASSGTAASR